MKRALDTIEGIDARLNELRKKFPITKSKLRCKMDKFLAADLKDTASAVKDLQALREVCRRTHGKDVWQVPAVSVAIREHLIALRKEALTHNLEWCFTSLERALDDNDPIQDPKSGTLLETVTRPVVSDGLAYEYIKITTASGDPERWRVDINGRRRCYNTCFNISATDKETGYCGDGRMRREIRVVTLYEYINMAMIHPDLHRKDTDLEGLCSILEDHILRIKEVFESETIDTEEIVLSFSELCAHPANPNSVRRVLL